MVGSGTLVVSNMKVKMRCCPATEIRGSVRLILGNKGELGRKKGKAKCYSTQC